ncbi:SDR family oxidoreductase [Chelatococcus sp. GCM10030263]|uniref:SDR family oxidoreductase n=1 Tax=Chelatococcus sp. GCM10030263 TaxID=3273387 RepID=UPI003608D6E6
MRLFVFGIGYSASAFITRYGERFRAIAGTVRAPGKAAELQAQGIDAQVFDGSGTAPDENRSAIATALAEADAVLVSVPPGADGCPAYTAFGASLAEAPRLRWIGYLSTVGVYGDHDGDWVDENTPPSTRNARSLLRLAAEKGWSRLASETGKRLDILRLPGIYGPGRNALVEVAAGRARRIARPGQVFNRIHVEDIAATLAVLTARAEHSPAGGGVYNVCDDEPAPQSDVIAYAARLLGLPPPPEVSLEEAGLSPMGLSFWTENKRICNARLKADLGLELAYPSYREGLEGLLNAGEGRGAP